MNVTMDVQHSSTKVTGSEIHTNTYRTSTGSTQMWNSADKLDIADKVTDDKAYQGQGMTAQDIMQQAQTTNVQAQKDFMIVMSNCVSGEDLAKMQENGFEPGSTDVETYVSIVDQIKVTLAEAGVKIAGYNDNLDAKIVEEITGSRIDVNELCQKFAQADLPVTKENIDEVIMADYEAQGIKELSEDALKYLLINKKEPTIENIYLAQFSSATNIRQSQGYFGEAIHGYYAKKADQIDYTQIEQQLATRIQESGMEVNADTMEQAKWLVEAGIEVKKENLTRLAGLREITLPKSAQEILDLSICAIQNGKSPRKALLCGEENLQDQAGEMLNTVEKISDQAIHETIASGQEINIRNLSQAQQRLDEGISKDTISNNQEESLREIEARRQLEEIRLLMTVEANKQLLKKGIQIDTTQLQELVEALKEEEKKLQATICQGENPQENQLRMQILEETVQKTRELPFMPAAVLGKLLEEKDNLTITKLHEEGKILQGQYDKAGETYEALMTKPRADLGDKISKAFQNVEDILKDLNLEVNEENKRAVRILGYNSMEITQKSIAEIKQADSMVQKVIEKMTPATTLQMIREQKNPLQMTMEELETYLDEKEQENGKAAERFSKYLQKMEHAGNISEEERDAYMGIFRLFRQIEKSDGAVIGSLVAAGAEINFKNMLSAVRTRANKNMDIRIDQEFGALEELIAKGKAIDTQISAGFGQEDKMMEKHYARMSEKITKQLAEDVEVESLQKMDIQESTTIEHFAQQVGEAAEKSAVEKSVEQEFRAIVKKAQEVNDAVLEELIQYELPVSVDHIEAAANLLLERGSLFRQIFEKEDEKQEAEQEENVMDVERETLHMIESLTDAKTANTSYQELVKKAIHMVEEKTEKGDVKAVDMKAAKALYKGLSLTSKLARQENYEIPMKIDGEVTSVNLKIYHDSNQKGKVTISMETENLGKVVADFEVNQEKVSGMVAYEKADPNTIKRLEEEVNQNFAEMEDQKSIRISYVKANQIDFMQFGHDRYLEAEENRISTKELYQTAKVFMTAFMTCTGNQKG